MQVLTLLVFRVWASDAQVHSADPSFLPRCGCQPQRSLGCVSILRDILCGLRSEFRVRKESKVQSSEPEVILVDARSPTTTATSCNPGEISLDELRFFLDDVSQQSKRF